jgi:hypothetical protein
MLVQQDSNNKYCYTNNGRTMALKYIDPDTQGIHPYREVMTDEQWDRMDRIIIEKSDEEASLEELEAYHDYCFDCISLTLQTTLGVLTLQ